MNRLKLIINVLWISSMLSSCWNKTAEDSVTTTDTLETSDDVPLDNIHRSHPADTMNNKEENKEQGIPLDNLDRDKKKE